MKVTKAVDYAFKACLYLAAKDGGSAFTSVRQLCEALDLRRAYLLKVLKVLEDNGIVKIQRGAHGGYRLARAAGDITVKSLVEAIDGPVAISYLVEDPKACGSAADRKIMECWKGIQQVMIERMQKTRLSDLRPRELFKA